MDAREVEEKRILSIHFINFCCELIELQLESGGRAVLEHPKPSIIWKLPKVQRLAMRMHEVECDMCRFGLHIPHGELIRKSTKLLVTHAEIGKKLGLKCADLASHQRHVHQPVAGCYPDAGSVSRFAGQYPPRFVKAVLE